MKCIIDQYSKFFSLTLVRGMDDREMGKIKKDDRGTKKKKKKKKEEEEEGKITYGFFYVCVCVCVCVCFNPSIHVNLFILNL